MVPRASLTRRGAHGSIQALQHSLGKAFHDQGIRLAARNYNYPTKYAVVLGLGVLPFLVNWDHTTQIASNKSSRLLLAAAVVLTFVLCLIAKDWGRFIYMNAAALTLVLLSQPPSVNQKLAQGASTWVGLALLYATTWRVPISDPSLEQGIIFQAISVIR